MRGWAPAASVTANSTRIINIKKGIDEVMYAGYPPEIYTIVNKSMPHVIDRS